MANIRLLKSHEKLIFLPFFASSKRRRERRDGFQSCELEKLVLRWVQYDDDAFMFCNLNAVFTIVNFCCDERRRSRKSDWKTPLDKRRTIVMLNIEHIFKPPVHANERAMMKIFYSASITLNSTNGHLQCLLVRLIPSPCHCPESFLRNVRPLFENNQFQ